MWHDDEGDESAGSGERPDPSTRHWRHPSELSQQGALPHPDPTPITATTAPSTATVWPLVAVGGCLAIAALGVIGLRTDLGRTDSLQAGSAATVASPVTTSRTAAAASEDNASTTSPEPRRRPDPTVGDDLSSWISPTSTLVTQRPPQTSTPPSADGQGTPSSELLDGTPLATPAEEAPVYGVYGAPGRDEGQLGSFVMIGDDPVTSSSSLGGRTTVWLRVETRWLEATLAAADPITDVALLDIVDGPEDVIMPTLEVATEPLGIGAAAMVGYGEPELPVDEDDGAPGDPSAGRGDGENGGEGTLASPNLSRERLTSTTARVDGPAPDRETKAWVLESNRRGVVYSLTKPLATGSGHLIHDPIRLTTTPGPADAGAPARNRDGEIIGLVAHSPLLEVAAVPIDRVVDAVGWLRETGVGDPAWLGVTVIAQSDGLVVTAVDEGGPAVDLAPGDVILAVDRQPIFHPDSLVYAAREAGPGTSIELTIDRKNRRRLVTVEVGTIPLL